MRKDTKVLTFILTALFASAVCITFTEVHWATKDTVFIWSEHCELIETCNGYDEILKKAMEDGKINHWEYWELEAVFNAGYDKYRLEAL